MHKTIALRMPPEDAELLEIYTSALTEHITPFAELSARAGAEPEQQKPVKGDWIEHAKPRFGSRVATRFENVREQAVADTTDALAFRTYIRHLAGELLVRFLHDRPALPALALTTDPTSIRAA